MASNFRLTFITKDGQFCGAVWKIKVMKSDCYVFQRGVSRVFKTSLHLGDPRRTCHLKFEPRYRLTESYIEKWNAGPKLQGDALMVLEDRRLIRNPVSKAEGLGDVVQIIYPPEAKAMAGFMVRFQPREVEPPQCTVFSAPLNNGDMVHVYCITEDLMNYTNFPQKLEPNYLDGHNKQSIVDAERLALLLFSVQNEGTLGVVALHLVEHNPTP